MDDGRFTIPTRIYLSVEERAKLDGLLRAQGRDLDELLTELLVAHIAAAPAPPPFDPADPQTALRAELRRRRAELRRLRPSLNDTHNPPPRWLLAMATELETEIKRLSGLVEE